MSETEGNEPKRVTADGGTEAAGRVADVLLLFTAGPEAVGVSEISRRLGLSKAVVHRIMQSLASREVVTVDREARGYALGPAAAALGARALRDSTLRAAALPVLRELRDATGETTTLSELVGDRRVYLDQFESPQEIKMRVEVGRGFPLHAGGSSKVILAFLPAMRREAILSGALEVLTPRTVTDREQLRAQLVQIARGGVAVSGGERQDGAGSVAAPVFGVDGVVGAISVCGPVHRFDENTCRSYTALVRNAAREISSRLGWHDADPVEVHGKEGHT